MSYVSYPRLQGPFLACERDEAGWAVSTMQCSGRESQRYLRFRGNFLIDLKKSTQFLQELPNTKYLRKSNFQSLGKNIIHKRSHSMIVAVIYIAPNPGFNLNKLT